MSLGPVFLPIEGGATPLGAAAYLALLAYPPSCSEVPKRDAFIDAARGLLAITALGGLPLQPERRAETALDAACYRIRTRRLPAAEMAWPLLAASCDRVEVQLVGRRPSIDAAVELMAPRLTARNKAGWWPEDIRRRIWAESRPVLHLALAYRAYLLSTPGRLPGHRFPAFDEVLLWPDWVGQAVRRAEWLRQVIVQTPSLGIADGVTYRVLPEGETAPPILNVQVAPSPRRPRKT